MTEIIKLHKNPILPASIVRLALGRPWDHVLCDNTRVLTLYSMTRKSSLHTSFTHCHDKFQATKVRKEKETLKVVRKMYTVPG